MLRIVFSNKAERGQYEHDCGPLEIGRGPRRDVPRCIIGDPFISHDQLRVEAVERNRVRLDNLSQRTQIVLADRSRIAPGSSCQANLPVRLVVGQTLIDIVAIEVEDSVYATLQTIQRPLPGRGDLPSAVPSIDASQTPSPETLAQWFETVIQLQQTAACSAEFYEQTARAVVRLVGLDYGLVLLERGDRWEAMGRFCASGDQTMEVSRSILKYVADQGRTFYQGLESASPSSSLMNVEAVVASPIFDAHRSAVIGAVYGCRRRQLGPAPARIQPLEAQLVQVLAATVSVGLARVATEAEAVRRRVQFEQFFSVPLARELDRDATLLEGRDREVTVLFSDLRGFSRLSERLGPHDTFRLVGDCMDRLTGCIRQHHGVVVDYTGDGILAMWNAPLDQPDHASLACRAALAMLGEIPGLNSTWHELVGTPLELGIGLNTGTARVGNTGSRYRLKYGPLGHTVNVASRVEGATKELGVPALITGSTQTRLPDHFATRRLCRARVPGMEGAVDLYELASDSVWPEWAAKRDVYESALALYEAGRGKDVPQTICPLLAGQRDDYDIPSLILLARTLECLKAPPRDFDPVLQLRRKA